MSIYQEWFFDNVTKKFFDKLIIMHVKIEIKMVAKLYKDIDYNCDIDNKCSHVVM